MSINYKIKKFKASAPSTDEMILNAIFNSSNEGIMIENSDNKVLVINDLFYDILKVPRKFAKTNDSSDVLWKYVKEQLTSDINCIKAINLLVSSQEADETLNFSADEKVIQIKCTSLLLSANFSVKVWIVSDITSKNKVTELEENLKYWEEKCDQKSQLFSSISHEFKTPLNIILSSLQLIDSINSDNSSFDCNSSIDKYLFMMKQNCYRLVRLVNNFIDINKLDCGFYSLNLRNKNIVKIIEDITLSIVEYTNGKAIELIFDTDEEEIYTAFDEEKLERIMLNLLSNAIKFTSQGGSIYVSVNNHDEYVSISIKDTGTGIPKENLQNLFSSFYQVNDLYRKPVEGSGLGLSLVKALVELHGGNISADSDYGKGSKFTFTFPKKLVDDTPAVDSIAFNLNESRIDRINIEFSNIYS